MKYLLICSLFFITHGDTLATNAQSTIVAKKFIMGDVTTTSISTGMSTPSTATLATTKCVDTMVKTTVHDSTEAMKVWATETFSQSISYSGTTNSSGEYTITFPTPYSIEPNIQISIPNQSVTNYFTRVSSVSTTGCTIHVYQRSTVTILGAEVLLATTTNVSGINVDVLVTQK